MLEKINLNPIIISDDKFKWFEDYDKLNIKNFKILYDFDEYKKNIIINTTHTTSNIYKINNIYSSIPFINYPFFKDELDNNYLDFNNFENL